MKRNFDNFELVEEPSEVEISGIRSLLVRSRFTMNGGNGQTIKVRSKTYAVPVNDFFYQMNFTDSQDGEDCTAEFDELLKTVTIRK